MEEACRRVEMRKLIDEIGSVGFGEQAGS